jgi:hypothetical protein
MNNIVNSVIKTWIVDNAVDIFFDRIMMQFDINDGDMPMIGDFYRLIEEINDPTRYINCTITNTQEYTNSDGNPYYYIFFTYISTNINLLLPEDVMQDMTEMSDDELDEIYDDDVDLLDKVEDDDSCYLGAKFPNDNLTIQSVNSGGEIGVNYNYVKFIR